MAVSKNAIEIYKQILNGLGAPITEENLKFLIAWQKAEGGTATNNPFNTTYNLDADVNKTKFNSHGVKNYTSPEYGIAATIKTLKLPYYKNIVKDLQNDAGALNIASNTSELKTWGTGNLVAKVLSKGVSVNTLSSEKSATQRALTNWAYTQEKNWSGVKEYNSKGVELLKEYNKRMGVTYKPGEHWSAITVSNAVMADAGVKTKDEMRALGFNPTKSHSGYVSDAFKTARDSDYKYNRYVAEKLDGKYEIGDILAKGRKDGKKIGTSKWSYEDFANSDKGYPSHADIIVDKGQDSKGEYIILAGGNLTNTYKNNKIYLSDIDKKKYKVKLRDTKPGVFISEDGNLIDQSEIDNKIRSEEDVLKTQIAENEILENDIDETLETDIDETNIISQRDYDLDFRNNFRLSDSAQMALFGTIIYPKNNLNSDFDNISYQNFQNTYEEELEEELEEEEELNDNVEELDNNVEELDNDVENKEGEKAWWLNDEKDEKDEKDVKDVKDKKDEKTKEYKKPTSMANLYKNNKITKKEYQEYLRTTSEFINDYNKLIKTASKKLKDLRKVVSKEKYSRPAQGAWNMFKPDEEGYNNIYGYTDADFKKIKEPYIDFANKYGYDPKNLKTKKSADQGNNEYHAGIRNGREFFEKNFGIEKDLETYNTKYKEYNRLKEGWTKLGYDVDEDGSISYKGESFNNDINTMVQEQKDSYQIFDFKKGKYVYDKSRDQELQNIANDRMCTEKGLIWLYKYQRCGTHEEWSKMMKEDLNRSKGYPTGPQYAGSDGGFFAGMIFGAPRLAAIPFSLARDMLWEAGFPPVIDAAIDAPFDMYEGAFGSPVEQYEVRKKYLTPMVNAEKRYNDADGFLNGINAYFGGDPKYNTGSWYNFDKGGSIELNLNKEEVLNYAKNGYIIEELPKAQVGDQIGEQEPVGVTYNPPPSFYTYNNNKYAKRGADWFKMLNGNYEPLTAGNVSERYKVLNKYAKPVKNVSKPKINQEPIKINESNILTHLKKREGEKNKTYEDSRGYLTGGVGHKLTEDEIKKYPLYKTIPQSQIDKWLTQDIHKSIEAAKKQAKELKISDPKFIEALTSVNFQLGTAWNTKHKKTWALMKEGAFDKAAAEATDSLWYNQTPVRVKDFQNALKQLNATKLQDGGFIEIDLTEEEVNKYKDGGYIIEELPIAKEGSSVGDQYYTVKASKGVYRKVNNKWEVDWDRSGNFQPLSKGDVAARTAVLNKQAKPLYDDSYYDLMETKAAEFKLPPKPASAKQQSKEQKIIQKNFDDNFKFLEGEGEMFETQHVVKKGDTLSKIAAENNTSVADIIKNNKSIVDPNIISINQKINLPPKIVNTPKEKTYEDWNRIRDQQYYMNLFPDEEKIINYYNNKPEEKYVIVDKKNGAMKLYIGSNLIKSYKVGVGKNPGDAQTVTKYIDRNKDGKITSVDKPFEVDWSAGNMSTGAGIFKVSQANSTGYFGTPIVNLKNESGIEVSTSFHKGFEEGNSRLSNGCVRMKDGEIKCFSKTVPIGTKVYILPEDKGNNFQIIDGKLALKVSAQNRQKYNSYVDQKGVPQKGQGVNQTINTLVYKPIKADFNEKKFKENVFQWQDYNDEIEYTNNTKPFINALITNKKDVMKAAKISSDVYNEIAKMAFGIYGTESNFGDEHLGLGNFNRAVIKFFDREGSSSPDVVSKYNTYNVQGNNNSVGYTQIRWSQLNDKEKTALGKLGITSNKDFMDPSKSAIATTTILGIRYNEQLTSDEKKDVWKNLPSKWNARSNYADRVKKNSSYLSLKQLDQKQNGGENNYIETELTDDEIEDYRNRGYIIEELPTAKNGGETYSYNGRKDGGLVGDQYYTVKASKGVYRKVNNKWEVDWDKSGNFQPLSKGDVAARSAVLDKYAKPLYDDSYYDFMETKAAEFKLPPKQQTKQKPTTVEENIKLADKNITELKQQKFFDKNFKLKTPDTYKYNDVYYQKNSMGEWTKDINGEFIPLTKGDVKARSKVLDKNAKLTTPLNYWNNLQKNNWQGITENTLKGQNIIKEYNDSIGTNLPYTKPWSALTISNAVMSHVGAKDLDSLKEAGFNPALGHWSYIQDAFKTANNPNYKFNRYTAVPLDDKYKIGDLLVKGRKGTRNWDYDDFAKHTKHTYPSHSDIIVDKGTDDKGDFIVIAGGNVGDTYINDKIYVNDINSIYKLKLNFNDFESKKPINVLSSYDSLLQDKIYRDNTKVENTPINNLFQQDYDKILELTDNEVEQYRNGGYIVEEIE